MKRVNYIGKKRILLSFVENPFVIILVKGLLKVFGVVDRLGSHLKLRALVPECNDCLAHWSIRVIGGENVTIGKGVGIGRNVVLGAGGRIVIGDAVRISDDVILQTAGLNLDETPPYTEHIYSPITIEDGVWIGARCLILGGVTVGRNSVIGAGTVVSKSVPPGSRVVGAAARVLEG